MMPAVDILDIVVSAPPGGEVTVVVAEPDADAITLVLPAPVPVEVSIGHALPGADGATGPQGPAGATGAPGPPGLTAEIVSAAEYAALGLGDQLDPLKWWVIPQIL